MTDNRRPIAHARWYVARVVFAALLLVLTPAVSVSAAAPTYTFQKGDLAPFTLSRMFALQGARIDNRVSAVTKSIEKQQALDDTSGHDRRITTRSAPPMPNRRGAAEAAEQP